MFPEIAANWEERDFEINGDSIIWERDVRVLIGRWESIKEQV